MMSKTARIAAARAKRYNLYLEKMDARDRRMVQYRYKGWTLQQIGDKFGVSRQRVHQIMEERGAPRF